MVDEKAIRATGIKQYFAIIKDQLGNWIVDPFPRLAISNDMRDLIQQLFEPQHTLQILDKNIRGASQSRIRDIWRFQAVVCALSLEKYGIIANDWVADFRAIAEFKNDKSIMSLTYGFLSICELYDKLLRDAAALDEEITSDRLFNFVLTGFSMIDWIKNDPSVPASAKDTAAIEKELYSDKWLRICGDLATASKHFKLTKRKPITSSTSSSNGYGMGRCGKGGYGVGEESIVIELNDGTNIDCLDLANGVQATWQRFFLTHGICASAAQVLMVS